MNLEKLVIIDGIKYYKKHFCKCGCGGMIKWNKLHSRPSVGIPDYIPGHNHRFEKGNKWVFKKGNHPITEFPKGFHPITEFKKGHKINVGIPRSQSTKDKISNTKKKYFKEHPEAKPMLGRIGENSPLYIDEYSLERNRSKHRGLEFFPLNEKTKKANEQHHINNKLVVFIPSKLHKRISHSVKTGKNMNKMNKLAFTWLEEQGIELQRNLFSFGGKK